MYPKIFLLASQGARNLKYFCFCLLNMRIRNHGSLWWCLRFSLIQEKKFSVNFPLRIHYFSLHTDQTPNRSNVWKERSTLAHGFRELSQSWWRRPGTVCQLMPKQPLKEKRHYRVRIHPLINFLQRPCLLIMPASCESIEGWMHWLGQSPRM